MTPKERFYRVVLLINHDEVNHFGPMHIAVSDGNMDDGNLDFIEGEMKNRGATAQEWELLNLLRQMHANERFAAWELA